MQNNQTAERDAASAMPEKGAVQRDSRFELLRVTAMLLIIAYHIVSHCVKYQLTDADSISRMENGLFNAPIYYKRLFLLDAMMTWGPIGNALFMLLTGYLARMRDYAINLRKTGKKLLTQLAFAASALVLVSWGAFLYLGDSEYIGLITITKFNSMSWYIGYYFIVLLIAVLFLNRFLRGMDRNRYGVFLIIMLALTQFSWSIKVLEGIGTGLSTVAAGVFLYSLGGYIQRCRPFGRLRLYVLILVPLAVYALIFLSGYNTAQLNIEDYLREESDKTFYQTVASFGNNSLIPISIAVCIFELFRRVRLPRSRVINWLGKSTLMVYLLHDNKFFYSLWRIKDWISLLADSPWRFLRDMALWSLGTFGAGLLAYGVFLGLCRACRRGRRLVVKQTIGEETEDERA